MTPTRAALWICIASALTSGAGLARADALSDLAAETLAFSDISKIARANGGWSSEPRQGALRFALPDPRGFVWAGRATRAKGSTESSPADSIELFAPESGAAAGEAFPLMADQSAMAFGASAPSKFSEIASCKGGTLESQVGAVITGPGKRELSLRSIYAPSPVLLAWIGARSAPTDKRVQANAASSIEALRAAAAGDASARAMLGRLDAQYQRSHGPALTPCPMAGRSANFWPAPFTSATTMVEYEAIARDPLALSGMFSTKASWRPEASFSTNGALALLDALADIGDEEALQAEEAARAQFGEPQGASIGFDHGIPEFNLLWKLSDGSRASLKYKREPSQARGSALFSIEPAGSKSVDR